MHLWGANRLKWFLGQSGKRYAHTHTHTKEEARRKASLFWFEDYRLCCRDRYIGRRRTRGLKLSPCVCAFELQGTLFKGSICRPRAPDTVRFITAPAVKRHYASLSNCAKTVQCTMPCTGAGGRRLTRELVFCNLPV